MASDRPIKAIFLGDASSLLRATKQAESGLDRVGGKLKTFGKVAGGAFLAGGAAAVGFAAASVKMAMDFESAMGEVRTLMPDIGDAAFGALQKDVLALSKEMGVATDQMVPALYQAISAGVPQDNVMTFMEVASKAAVGGVTTLETAVDGITSVVNAYGSEVIDAQRAADVMFTGVKLGKTTFDELSGALFNVLPTASSLGVSFEEVTAALATMTLQGVPTSVATTQLRAAFVEASKGGSKLDKALQDLHGKGFANLMADGFNAVDLFQGLRESMPEQEFRDLFGSVEAMNAALQITGPNFEGMNHALNEAQNAAGAVDAAFATVSETTKFKLDKAMNQLKVMMIEFGGVILPYVASFISGTLIPAFERFSGWFQDNRPQIESAIGSISSAVRTMAQHFKRGMETVMPVLIAFGQWIVDNKPALVLAIGAIGLAIVMALGPVSLSVAAIVGLVTLIGWMRENWDEISSTVSGIVGDLRDTITGAFERIAEKISGAIDSIDAKFAPLLLLFGPLGALAVIWRFRDEFVGAFEWIASKVDGFISGITENIERVKGALDSIPTPGDIPGAGAVGKVWELLPFDNGGVVPGRIGAPMPILAHGGETILPTHKRGGFRGGGNITINVAGTVQTERSLRDVIIDAIYDARERGINV
jgi:TP901 family phage tail tape measure protein